MALGSLLPGVVSYAAAPKAAAPSRAEQLRAAARAVDAARSELDHVQSNGPSSQAAIDQLRHDLLVEQAGFAFREAVRAEQAVVYDLAAHPETAPAELKLLPRQQADTLSHVTDALHAAWRLFGIDDLRLVHPRFTHRFLASEQVGALIDDYRAAGAQTGVDWTYLAAINFFESDFGRNNGPSSAGALGPMQFLPSTWAEYGRNGDIMSPHDSIFAAARFLVANGAPADYDRALLHYNHDRDYVEAVKSYALAIRSDEAWVRRLHAWGTFG
jgi:hypothetical protein